MATEEEELDLLEERLKAGYRAFYLRVGAAMAVVAFVCATFLFATLNILSTQSLEPARSLTAALNGVLAFVLLIRKKWLLSVLCLTGAVATISYLPRVLAVSAN
jgi:hypothetical protein